MRNDYEKLTEGIVQQFALAAYLYALQGRCKEAQSCLETVSNEVMDAAQKAEERQKANCNPENSNAA